jgi:hypothetical protein
VISIYIYAHNHTYVRAQWYQCRYAHMVTCTHAHMVTCTHAHIHIYV